jgi:hypothetical protein
LLLDKPNSQSKGFQMIEPLGFCGIKRQMRVQTWRISSVSILSLYKFPQILLHECSSMEERQTFSLVKSTLGTGDFKWKYSMSLCLLLP